MCQILHRGYFALIGIDNPVLKHVYAVRYTQMDSEYTLAITTKLAACIFDGMCNDSEIYTNFTYMNISISGGKYCKKDLLSIPRTRFTDVNCYINNNFDHITDEDVFSVIRYLNTVSVS